jgi:hypothetical protein
LDAEKATSFRAAGIARFFEQRDLGDAARKEPWGQVVTRLLGPEGLLVGITYTPLIRK